MGRKGGFSSYSPKPTSRNKDKGCGSSKASTFSKGRGGRPGRDDDEPEVKPSFEYNGFIEGPQKRAGDVPFQAAKKRFFAQNYQPQPKDSSGYMIAYQLVVSESDYEKILKLLQVPDITLEYEQEIITLLEDSFVLSATWDRIEQDLISISKRAKGVKFMVLAVGEDFPYDFWVAYAQDGRYYQDQVDIELPAFDPARFDLMESLNE